MTDLKTNMKTQLAWQCRRGMLELDVILKPFLENFFDDLEQQQKDCFAQLLNETDPDLYTWLMGYGQCSTSAFIPMIELIREKLNIGCNKA